MVNVLFVCMGNICRSPTAEGVFTHLVRERSLQERIAIDSAGTIAHHVGDPPDERAQATALKYGIDIGQLRARQVAREDFERFDYVLAMDLENLLDLQDICPEDYLDRLHLFCAFGESLSEKYVPDPYYGGEDGFENVYRIVRAASEGLLGSIVEEHISNNEK